MRGSNGGAGQLGVAGVAEVSMAEARTTPETDAAANDEAIVLLEDAPGYVVRWKPLEIEESGSCCCYGRRKLVLDALKQKARATISDAQTGEILVEKVFEPLKTCPEYQDWEGIEPAFVRSVSASVIEAWAKRAVRELDRKKRQRASVPKD